MTDLNRPGCMEYNSLSRRQLLRGAVGAGALSTLIPAWLPQVAYAQSAKSTRDVMVSIFLRGGADGLSLCVPYGDPGYYAAGLRPNLAISQPDSHDPYRAIDLDGFFGFPQAMAALKPAYDAGHLLVVHATGSTDPTRSHFQAQNNMEAGEPNSLDLQTGWLGRHLASVQPMSSNAPLRGLALGYAISATLAGAPATLATPDPGTFKIAGDPNYAQACHAWLLNAYSNAAAELQEAATTALNTLDLLHKINFAGYQPGGGVVYPSSAFGRTLCAAAALIRAQVGVEAIHTDYGVWDTHFQQGPQNGYMAHVMQDFAASVAAFHADLFNSGATDVTLAVVSEFGRTAQQNASQGTDHGHGNAMFVLGGQIAGGRVLSQWPGLSPGQLDEGSALQVTIDYRDILAEIVQRRLGNSALSVVFPNYTPVFRGVTHN